ncbi:MAG: hypothetical protein FIB01_01015 [Gemmatimonadetes bacterium]|nr:hypothetical protein [Gemmatimonadota bacterium]
MVALLAPAVAWAQHAHAAAGSEHRLHSSMWGSGLLIGLMPYALALIVGSGVLGHRRRRRKAAAGSDRRG